MCVSFVYKCVRGVFRLLWWGQLKAGVAFTLLVIALRFSGHIDVTLLMVRTLIDEGGEANDLSGCELAAYREYIHHLPLEVLDVLVQILLT